MSTALDVLTSQQDATLAAVSKVVGPQLPEPTGYKLLVKPYTREKKGSLFLPQDHASVHDIASICAQVVAKGPDAYADTNKFTAPYCKVGDWIIFRSYTGTRLKHGETEYRLINDDTVEAVVADPESVERA